jgi:hypothetical protein
VVLSTSTVSAQGGSISLDYLSGASVYDGSKLPAGRPIYFDLRITNPGTTIQGMTTGFRVFSPDGATWEPTAYIGDYGYGYDTAYLGIFVEPESLYVWDSPGPGEQEMFDGANIILTFSIDGVGADTVGFAGLVQEFGVGFPTGFDFVGFQIGLDSVTSTSAGMTLCLDSSYYPPSSIWLWANGTSYPPAWDGPHCYEIVDCCLGMRGNINHDNADEIDISDLNVMVNYMFRDGPTPPCLAEANIDGAGDSNPDIADLNGLVAYMFKNGSPPAVCQ